MDSRFKAIREMPSFYLEPGYIYFAKGPIKIRTVVGTCIAVCVWDRVLKYGGMNHFQKPSTIEPTQATPRYGNVSTATLLAMMTDAGCQPENIVAQILGGASPQGTRGQDIGLRNAEVARAVLNQKGVRLHSEDVGGNMGRKIVFDTRTGELLTFKVHELREDDWMSGISEARFKKLLAHQNQHATTSASYSKLALSK